MNFSTDFGKGGRSRIEHTTRTHLPKDAEKACFAAGSYYSWLANQRIFTFMDRKIKYYRLYDKEASKEDLIKERELLFKIAQKIDLRDLWILYYICNIKSLGKSRALKNLKSFYNAERKFFKETFQQ